jgi:hypothetical protein
MMGTVVGTGRDSDSTYRISAASVSRVIRLEGGTPRTIEVTPTLGQGIAVEGQELSIVLDSATWRHDIPMWRWIEEPDEQVPVTWADPGFDDSDWRLAPHLHPVITARAAAPSWFRARVTLPIAVKGSSVSIVLGGLDGQDWSEYSTYIDGRPLDSRTASGAIREPHRTTITADDPRYRWLRFGEPMLLAVRCAGLTRSHPDMVPGEQEHHFFADWLIDQYVAAGEPTRTLGSFSATDVRSGPDESWLEYDLVSDDEPSVTATIRHSTDGEVLRKAITIHNRGETSLPILDVVSEDWRGSFEAAYGGRGQPVMLADAFVGIEHPAGVSQADTGAMRLVEMSGETIAAGASWQAQTVVLGGRDETGVESAFREYVMGLRDRPVSRVRVYSALGWYDYTNPADPLPELTADLVTENLGQLRELREEGASFDIYMLDDWWDYGDLGRFRSDPFPEGHVPIGQAISDAGMRVGLWWATTRALWSEKDAPGIEASWANDPSFGEAAALSGGKWRWLEEFTNLMIGERRFCLASEPYRSHYLEALPHLVADLDAQMLKLDCSVLHCTSSDHDHRPGRHSMHPMVDALVDLLSRCREASADLRVVWYWGFSSPWFARFGEVLFDKGLLMEAATVSSTPAPTVRQSLTTNVDQAIRHARFLPLRLQDSLGIWLGDVAWCNRIGTEEWREALLVDIARGSDQLQVWGDMTLLSREDRADMAAIFGWLDRHGLATQEVLEIGGDPWQGQAYGYVRSQPDGLVVTLVNPDWHHAEMALPTGLPGWPEGTPTLVELYPFPGRVEAAGEGALELTLAPFEVRVVEVVSEERVGVDVPAQRRPAIGPTVELDVAGAGGLRRADEEETVSWSGRVRLPRVRRGDVLYVMHRLERDGEWAYQPEPQALLGFEATLDGLAVHMTTIPNTRDRNGPGSPWVLRRIPAGPAWSGRDLEVTLHSTAPRGVRVHTRALLVDAWWLRHRRSFDDLF